MLEVKYLMEKKKKKKPRICLDRTYSAETENWKHCSKIIFKCVNSTVGSIFNENNCWKVEFVNPWIVHGYTVHHGKVNLRGYYSMNSAWTVVALLLKCVKKKKGWNTLKAKRGRNKSNPNLLLMFWIKIDTWFCFS